MHLRFVCAGATILGRIVIGQGATIGGNEDPRDVS